MSKRRNIMKGTLKLRIREGKNLPRMDDIGLSDPYVVVKAFGQEKKTEVREVTLNPVWEEELVFEVNTSHSNDDKIVVEVYDYDRLQNDDLCGMFVVKATEMCLMEDPDENAEKWWFHPTSRTLHPNTLHPACLPPSAFYFQWLGMQRVESRV